MPPALHVHSHVGELMSNCCESVGIEIVWCVRSTAGVMPLRCSHCECINARNTRVLISCCPRRFIVHPSCSVALYHVLTACVLPSKPSC